MEPTQRLEFFSSHFDLIADGCYSNGPKIYISTASPGVRECRFCDRSHPTFATEAHAIPQSLGNFQLVLKDECDGCNKYFSEALEDHFDKFTKPFRTLAQIRGNRKIPTYKSLDQQTRIEVSDQVSIVTQFDAGHVTVDVESRQVGLELQHEPYVPAAVYKALVKFALSTITSADELPAFQSTIAWILNPDHTKLGIKPLLLFQTFVPGPRPNPKVVSLLYRRKPGVTGVPYAVYVLAFGNVVYQIMVPSRMDALSGERILLKLPYHPTPFEFGDWPFGKVKVGMRDMSSPERTYESTQIFLSAESFELMK